MKSVFDLSRFDEYKEDNRREVKSATGGLPSSLWETYSSMANTYGGVIICGVKEHNDGSWATTGLKDVSKLLKDFWNQANDTNKVSINLLHESDVMTYTVGTDIVFVIKVPMADRENKPIYINGNMFKGSFKRNNEGDYHCTETEVRAMLRDQPRKTIDGKVISNMDLSVLDKESIRSYRTVMESKRPGHVFLSLSSDEFLEAIGAAKIAKDGKLRPTCAGLLMFGKEYKILYEYENYFLDYREHLLPDVRWTDRIQSQSGDWSGNVFDFFSRVAAKLVLDLKKPFKLVDMVRIDETPLHDAVREALVNCLVNTDFFEPRGVVIEKYPDRIEFRNPGVSIVGKKQMLHGGESEPRNAGIMKMFNLIGFGERAGSGIPDIYATWREAGYIEPTVEELFGNDQPNRTIVTLPLTEKDFLPQRYDTGEEKREEKGEETREALVISLIKDDPKISMSKMAEQTGYSAKQIEKTIDKLKARGIVSRSGADNGGVWIINE